MTIFHLNKNCYKHGKTKQARVGIQGYPRGGVAIHQWTKRKRSKWRREEKSAIEETRWLKNQRREKEKRKWKWKKRGKRGNAWRRAKATGIKTIIQKRALQALIQDRLDDSPGNGYTTALPPTWHGKFFSLFMFKQPSIVALNCKVILSFIL